MAEELAREHMRAIGFSDARRTTGGADGGIDIRAGLAVAQVKHLSQPVGSPDVQRLRGAAHGVPHAVFYSSSGYSAAAIAVAETSQVALFRYATTGDVVAINEQARSLESGALSGSTSLLVEALEALQDAAERGREMIDRGSDVAMSVAQNGLDAEYVELADVGNTAALRFLEIDDEWRATMTERLTKPDLTLEEAQPLHERLENVCASAQRALTALALEMEGLVQAREQGATSLGVVSPHAGPTSPA
ncbi:restriction endonuclease (plasmid) [Curtobacterium sp. MCLR17_007]|uniref:restriction endonuclease n=1 Tax=Curtobacterium sp. MCLR17_007 TaxID=2175648 RepID=UPI0011B48A88|nr:restriction endonuclease [Curtobacterium sp. MCLR17_007]WIB62124.1 restriction endonuclease [Curtobacterium sp. MCLR17_007]